MSWDAVTFAMQFDVRPAARKLVYITLAYHVNAKTKDCFPGVKTISAQTGQSQRSVIAHLNGLVEDGLIIRRTRHRKNGSRTSNGYVFVGFDEWLASAKAIGDRVLSAELAHWLIPQPSAESALGKPDKVQVLRGNVQVSQTLSAESAPLVTIREPTSKESKVLQSATGSRFAPAGLLSLWIEWFGTDRETLAREHGGGFLWEESNAAQQMFADGCRSEEDLDEYFEHVICRSQGQYVPLSPASEYRRWRRGVED